MSVYTELSGEEIAQLLQQYNLGEYQSHQGIKAGVENTNYFVTTNSHQLVLTLFETLPAQRLPFYLLLCEHLNHDGCAVPKPYRQKSGELVMTVKTKPAVFIERLSGRHVDTTQPYLAEIGTALAKVHLSSRRFKLTQSHSHSLTWIQQNAAGLIDSLDNSDQSLLNQALNLLASLPELPSGIIHADLFHDNVLFDGPRLVGIIDWYFAGHDSYALDIAISLNDWCLDKAGHYNPGDGSAFIQAYQAIRPLSAAEQQSIPLLQVQSATRFWLSRVIAQRLHGESSDTITVKDPNKMKQLLTELIQRV
jgi:homoserine kinase type II